MASLSTKALPFQTFAQPVLPPISGDQSKAEVDQLAQKVLFGSWTAGERDNFSRKIKLVKPGKLIVEAALQEKSHWHISICFGDGKVKGEMTLLWDDKPMHWRDRYGPRSINNFMVVDVPSAGEVKLDFEGNPNQPNLLFRLHCTESINLTKKLEKKEEEKGDNYEPNWWQKVTYNNGERCFDSTLTFSSDEASGQKPASPGALGSNSNTSTTAPSFFSPKQSSKFSECARHSPTTHVDLNNDGKIFLGKEVMVNCLPEGMGKTTVTKGEAVQVFKSRGLTVSVIQDAIKHPTWVFDESNIKNPRRVTVYNAVNDVTTAYDICKCDAKMVIHGHRGEPGSRTASMKVPEHLAKGYAESSAASTSLACREFITSVDRAVSIAGLALIGIEAVQNISSAKDKSKQAVVETAKVVSGLYASEIVGVAAGSIAVGIGAGAIATFVATAAAGAAAYHVVSKTTESIMNGTPASRDSQPDTMAQLRSTLQQRNKANTEFAKKHLGKEVPGIAPSQSAPKGKGLSAAARLYTARWHQEQRANRESDSRDNHSTQDRNTDGLADLRTSLHERNHSVREFAHRHFGTDSSGTIPNHHGSAARDLLDRFSSSHEDARDNHDIMDRYSGSEPDHRCSGGGMGGGGGGHW